MTLSLVVTLHAVLPAQRARLQAERAIPAEVSAATDQLLGVVGGSSTAWIRIDQHEAWFVAAMIANQLEKAGRRFVVDDGWTFMFGEQHRRDECPAVLIGVGSAPPPDALAGATIYGVPAWARSASEMDCGR